MKTKLTQKQEAFCVAYIESGQVAEAYKKAYNTENCTSASISQMASKALTKPNIQARLEELRAPVRERAQISLEAHLARLEHLSLMAEAAEQYSAAIKAEENRGKVSGLYTEKVQHSGDPDNPINHSIKVQFVDPDS